MATRRFYISNHVHGEVKFFSDAIGPKKKSCNPSSSFLSISTMPLSHVSYANGTVTCYPVDPGSAVYYGIVSDTVENEAQAFNLSRRLLHIFQMRVGPNLWNDGVIGYQILPLVEQGRLMAGLFDIVCQNFESNVDSILGLHEDVNVRKVEPTALEKIFNPWKEFVDSLVKPKLAAQAPSAPPRTNWAGRSQEKESEDLTNSPRCLLWYKSSQKIVLLASNCRALLDEDCLLLKDHIPFLLQPPIPPQASAVSQAASVDAASSVLIEGTSDGVQEFLGSSISSVLDVAESSRVGGSASASGLDQLSSFFPDIVFLGQIDDRSGSYLPGKQKFLLYQNIFFEDKDGVLVLQSLFPHVPPDTTLALPSNSDNEKLLSESVESFKDKLTKSFASNPWSIMVHHNMDTFIMDFPGLVQFLCINRSQNKLFSPGPHGHCSAKKMEDEMRQCVLWGLLQRQADMFTSVATMNGKQYAYLLWVEDSSGIEISFFKHLCGNPKQALESSALMSSMHSSREYRMLDQQMDFRPNEQPTRIYEFFGIFVGCMSFCSISKISRELVKVLFKPQDS